MVRLDILSLPLLIITPIAALHQHLASSAALLSQYCPWTPLQMQPALSCNKTENKIQKGDVNTETHSGQNNNGTLWRGPHVCAGSYCVYSNPSFAQGHGIAIVTRSWNFERITKLQVFSQPQSSVTQGASLYRETEVLGKGIGLVATKLIHRGQQIMAHTPAVLAHRQFIDDLTKNEQSRLMKVAVQNLPAQTRKKYMALMGHAGRPKELDIFRTNSFGMWLGIEDGHHAGNFPEVSRYNHDCRPNVVYYIDQDLKHYSHAVRDIHPGEELSVAYIDSFQARLARQERLNKHWGFQCTCSHCVLPETLANASDYRLSRISEIEAELNDWTSTTTTDIIELLLSLYQQERLLESHGAIAYRLAALNYNAFGKQDLATKYSILALEAELLMRGLRSREVQDMIMLMEDPMGHWTWKKRVGVWWWGK